MYIYTVLDKHTPARWCFPLFVYIRIDKQVPLKSKISQSRTDDDDLLNVLLIGSTLHCIIDDDMDVI